MKCDSCGIESDAEELFWRTQFPIRSYCPACQDKTASRQSLIAATVYAATGAFGLVLASIDQSSSIGWLYINLSLTFFLFIPVTLLHEMGHTIVALLVGQRILGLRIGHGATLLHRRLLGLNIEWKTMPFNGAVILGRPSSRPSRSKMFLIFMAGPMIHVVILVLLVALLAASSLKLDNYLAEPAPISAFMLANAAIMLLNLWPRRLRSNIGVVSSDGQQLTRIPFLSNREFEDWRAACYAQEALEAETRGLSEDALRLAQTSLDISNDNQPALLVKGVVQCSMGLFEEASSTFSTLLGRDDLTPGTRFLCLNNAAWAYVLLGDRELLPDADAFSAKAFRNLSWIPGVKATRGAVLVEKGNIHGGLSLLKQAISQVTDPRGVAACACYIAIGLKRQGDDNGADRYLKRAHALDPACPLLDRASRESVSPNAEHAYTPRPEHRTEASQASEHTDHGCPRCGNFSSGDWPDCIYCGEPLIDAAHYVCSQCGTEVQDEDRFCPECGQLLDETE